MSYVSKDKKPVSKIKVFLADDHQVVRDGLSMVLGAEDDIEVVGHAGDGRTAVREIARLAPDVVVMDVRMPEMNGIEATRRVLELCAKTKIVILSMAGSSEHVHDALTAGAIGYVLKDSAADEVVRAVRAAHKGKRFLSAQITETIAETFMNIKDFESRKSPIDRLSPREREVLHMVVNGKSSGEIAAALSLSPKTVDTYRSRIMKKLAVKGVSSLVKFAIEHGLVELD